MDETHLNLNRLSAAQRLSTSRIATSDTAATIEAIQPLDGRAKASDHGVELSSAVQKINDFIRIMERDLEFRVDEETARTIVTVRDGETGEIIRQIPSEEVLRLAENLEEARGLLVKTEA